MTDDNSNLVDMDNDEAFEAAFFGREPVATDEAKEEVEEKEEEVLENEDDALATEAEDEDEDGDDEPEGDEDPEDEPEPAPKKKTSVQERINELTRQKREAERREADLIKRIEAIEARKNEETDTEPKPLRETLAAEAPSPDALDENGEPVYPLGEFDPSFIRDLTRFTIEEERKAAKVADEEARQKAIVEAAQEELKSSWAEKVIEAEKELPELREALSSMDAAFEGIDPDYGEFLAATIMSCDYGPQIMYFLSQNIGEAQKIVASGPAAATLALGRLDASFSKPKTEKRNTKQSSAPTPPEARTRGTNGKFATAADTDDLDAFEKEFFRK